MRILLVKSNPNHDERGRFAAAESRIGDFATHSKGVFKVGLSPRETAKRLSSIAQTDRKHVLAKSHIAASILMHAHDLSVAEALRHMQATNHPAKSWESKRPFNLDILNPKVLREAMSKPSSADYKEFLKARVAKDSESYKRAVKGDIISKRSLMAADALNLFHHEGTSIKDAHKMMIQDKGVRQAANMFSASPATIKLALDFDVDFKEGKKEVERAYLRKNGLAKMPKGMNVDHVKAKGLYFLYQRLSVRQQ